LKLSSISKLSLSALLVCASAAAQTPGVQPGTGRAMRRDQKMQQRQAPPATALRSPDQAVPSPQPPSPQPGSAPAGHAFQGPGHLGYWLTQNRNLSLEQQRQALSSDPQFRSLSPERQKNLMRALERFNSMTPQQQERMLHNMEIMEHWTPEQRLQARSLVERARQLPADRREEVRRAISMLRHQEPPKRMEVLASPDFRARFNDRERDIIVGALDLGLPAGRVNPRRQQEAANPPVQPPQ